MNPADYMSIIVDGMAQTHSQLPWCVNLKDFHPHINQHICGILNHGRSFNMYRTFHTTRNNGNLAMHCIQLTIEKTLCLIVCCQQIDGGSENTSKSCLAMCELLVIRGLTKRIVLTRLPVGHTHEDIDARFALIWKRAQLAHLLTLSQYSRMAISATSVNCPFPSNVIDIYAVPDYDSHLRPCIDKKFGRYAKEEVTQLQFIFEAVEPNNFFHLE